MLRRNPVCWFVYIAHFVLWVVSAETQVQTRFRVLITAKDFENRNENEYISVKKIKSVLNWSEGPFVVDIFTCQSGQLGSSCQFCSVGVCSGKLIEEERKQTEKLSVYLFDSDTHPSNFLKLANSYINNPESIRTLLSRRHHLKVQFSLSRHAPHAAELRWAHFRGNTKLVPLGREDDSNGEMWIQPSESVVQYTSGGHLYAVLIPDHENNDMDRSNYESTQGYINHPDFAKFETLMGRVRGLYLMPAVYQENKHPLKIELNAQKQMLWNAKTLLNGTQCSQQTSGSYNNSEMIVISDKIVWSNCVRELLMKYWQHQRLSQVNVNTWALPTIATIPKEKVGAEQEQLSTTVAPTLGSNSLWKVFNLPTQLRCLQCTLHLVSQIQLLGQNHPYPWYLINSKSLLAMCLFLINYSTP